MFQSRAVASILKRNKAILNSLTSNLRGTSASSVFTSSSAASSNTANKVARASFMALDLCLRNMSTVASVGTEKEGLKLLVTAGQRAQKRVGIWLFGSTAWVFNMVVLGCVTQLSRSGLSMTDWKFTGNLPSLSDEECQQEFEKYKQSPEYKRMEYAHRMWGRALGVMFASPFSYFLLKAYITLRLGLRLSVLFALGTGQGLIGWWMVKSGLEEPASEYIRPRVSPYRLAAHLTAAFVIYSGLFWTALSVVMPEPPSQSLAWVQGAAKVKRLAIPVSLIVGITAVAGAVVVGNDAVCSHFCSFSCFSSFTITF
ncbi:cytochrome c oxidase assembly protein COX15-like [Durio zibethinus]|uniref:Cytochrome c oxidase assembly protein COX15-like n=1 Tax=Durio zibethinus TaxID=66656 RepID=A0A6P5WPS8_DURZI|nr:cytochrome c oxidase assembly protein COX15-like [Durio zibethinus]